MDIASRPAVFADLAACRALLRGRRAYDPTLLTGLPAVWRGLLREQALAMSVVEDRGARRRGVLAFGAAVFVTDACMAEARAGVTPGVTARVIRQELAGPSPILRPPEIRKGQRDHGLNVLVLHYAEATGGLDPKERQLVRYAAFEAFLAAHRGYRIDEVLQEFWDEIDREYVVKGWGRLRSDYAAYWRGRGPRPPEPGPFLVGITRAEALTAPGTIMAPLFVWSPPRFGLRPAEQRLLWHASRGETDPELARTLGVALATVKSRWRAIYERIGSVAPDLLPDTAAPRAPHPSRGKEKRRRLLEYLRRHPEELRPAPLGSVS